MMQDLPLESVLNSEGSLPGAMNGTTDHVTDESLMLAFVNGSPDAFTELFGRYRQPIHAFFCRRLSDPIHAEELGQEVFLALLRSAKRYESRALSGPISTPSHSRFFARIAASSFFALPFSPLWPPVVIAASRTLPRPPC